jgi:hypothetical protein
LSAAAFAIGAAAAPSPPGGAADRKELQNRHLIASSWISSAQNGHFFIAPS